MGRSRQASVQWRYDICNPPGSPEDILKQRVQQSGFKIGDIKSISEPVPMQYAIVYPSDSDLPFYLGIAPLNFGRHLELRVVTYQQFGVDDAENLFLAARYIFLMMRMVQK